MTDLPSQYAEDIETFRQILNLPDPRDTMPRSSTTIWALDDEKGQQELFGPLLCSGLNWLRMKKSSSLKKAPLKRLRFLDPIKTSPFVVPTIRKEAPTGNAPMGDNPLPSSNQSFSSGTVDSV